MEMYRIWRQLMIRCLSAAVGIALLVAGVVKPANFAPATEALVAVLLVLVLTVICWRFLLFRRLPPFDAASPSSPVPKPRQQRARIAPGRLSAVPIRRSDEGRSPGQEISARRDLADDGQ
ncbi:MAG: hypothetical protein C4346_18355 [Chloroflexota bacterium]